MASFTQDGIQFTSVLKGKGLPGKYGNAVDQRWTAGDISTSLNTQKNINAVQIDWNGAEITSTAFPSMDRTINTTGDLLSWIKEGIEEAAVSGRTSEVVRRSLWIN